ncbi:MAG: phage replisome organizer [Clostridium butyricum]|nr:phage replisome organizer [Clostridium butyricum]
MRERKSIKLRVDMNEDTKFKIIDRKPERDLIYCIWIKLLLLAGKVNKEGELHLSKSIPYTIETLAIEFNRDANQVKLALNVFLELEMIELTKHNIYKVKNFVKHQNIKVKEKNNSLDHIKGYNKEVDNTVDRDNSIQSENQNIENNAQDNFQSLNKEDVIHRSFENKIDMILSKKEKFENKTIDIRNDDDLKEYDMSLDIKSMNQHKKECIAKEESKEKKEKKLETNFNVANDIKVIKQDTIIQEKRTSGNPKKKTKEFKDGFQNMKEKFVSETVERLGEFKEKKDDKVLFQIDF